MGGAADLPQRASSPLKRPASDLEAEVSSSQKDDVDMIMVPTPDSLEPVDGSAQSSLVRAQSVDMLRKESEVDAAAVEQGRSTIRPRNVETSMHEPL